MDPEIAVFGASGYIGAHLAEELVATGHHVLPYGGPSTSAARSAAPSAGLDTTSALHPVDVVRDEIELPPTVRAVYYLAQSPHYRTPDDHLDHLLGVNAYGALRAAMAARAAGAVLFAYASTGNVYAPGFQPHREDDPVARANAYGASKLVAEEFLALMEGPMQCVCCRIFGAFGPQQRGMLPATIAARVRGGEAIHLGPAPGDSEDIDGLRVSFCYVRDLARILRRLYESAREGAPLPSILNLAGPEPISLRALAEGIGRVVGRAPRFEIGAESRRFDLRADIGRLRGLFDPAFTPFEQALRESYGSSADSGG